MKIDEQILKNNYFSEALAKIKEIVSIPSYAGEATLKAPYGENVLAVLEYAVSLAKALGFEVYQDPDGKYGYVEYGQGSKTFAILGHLDVVPPGNLDEWKTPPFKPEIIENVLYGRGVLDDKGPTIIILYCLKYLKDNNIKFKHKIRLIFGLTEETTWDSINTYMEKEGTPDFGFTPDGLFPLTYAEKAIINADIIGVGHENIIINGGDAYNVTCATCINKLPGLDKFYDLAKNKNYRIEKTKDSVMLFGKPAHGSRPAEGINAGLRSLMLLSEMQIKHPLVQFVAEKLKEDTAWTEYFAQYDDESGSFTINVGIVKINKNESKLCCNIRVPVHTDYRVIVEKIEKLIAPYNLKMVITHYDKPLYMPLNSPIVVKLMNIYKNVTNDKNAKPIAIGGGTYARSMPNCVAFGAIFDEKTSTEHTYNECIKLADLWKAMLIYVQAITTLANM